MKRGLSWKSAALLSLLWLISLPAGSLATQVTVTPALDAYSTDDPYVGSPVWGPTLTVSDVPPSYAFITFDISNLTPGSHINSATLTVYAETVGTESYVDAYMLGVGYADSLPDIDTPGFYSFSWVGNWLLNGSLTFELLPNTGAITFTSILDNANNFLANGPSLLIDYTSPPVDPVPEPATFMLLGAGLIGLAGYSRRKLC